MTRVPVDSNLSVPRSGEPQPRPSRSRLVPGLIAARRQHPRDGGPLTRRARSQRSCQTVPVSRCQESLDRIARECAAIDEISLVRGAAPDRRGSTARPQDSGAEGLSNRAGSAIGPGSGIRQPSPRRPTPRRPSMIWSADTARLVGRPEDEARRLWLRENPGQLGTRHPRHAKPPTLIDDRGIRVDRDQPQGVLSELLRRRGGLEDWQPIDFGAPKSPGRCPRTRRAEGGAFEIP